MKAFLFQDSSSGLELRDLPIPEPGPGQALIAVKAAGLCHSDTHVVKGGGDAWMCKRPIVLGHEVAGTVIKFGPNTPASSFKPGDSIVVACVGHPIEERNFAEAIGVGHDGGYAEFALAYCKHLVRIPDGVSFAQAAVATDSISTAYHAVVTEGRAAPSTTVAVIGLGGLGLNGVAIAALQGARVYGVDINTDKFEQAKSFGTIDCSSNLDAFSDVVFDIIIDFAGVGSTTAAAMSAVKLGGRVVVVGLGASSITIPSASLVTRNIELRGSTSASMEELRSVLELISSGALSPNIEEIPFEDIPKGLELLGTNQVLSRLYAVPG
ncbi:chaperonin 10-like protein [Macrophomina phaseolina]|uniref:Chaperonin 10-like protein n=1 Tax=Macrophomina phaseolina TaxID=35725 RepID=A0ABQ8GDE0_9PEZI|nr:chaperonin 10-like protein [Macrophomina phaseolina]